MVQLFHVKSGRLLWQEYFIKFWLLSELVTQELLWQLKTSKSAPSFSRLHILFEEPQNLNLGTSRRFFYFNTTISSFRRDSLKPSYDSQFMYDIRFQRVVIILIYYIPYCNQMALLPYHTRLGLYFFRFNLYRTTIAKIQN